MAKNNDSLLPVHPHLLMVGLGVSVTLALAVAIYTPMPHSAPSIANIQQVDDSFAYASPTPCATSCQTITLAPSEDARVKRTEPKQNYGSAVELRAENDGSGSYYESYLKFDLSFIPTTSTVTNAFLKLYTIDDTKNGPQLFRVADTYKGSTVSWVESGLNWNNKPIKVGSILGNKSTIARNTYVTYDVTALVNRYKGLVYSFGLFPDSTDGLDITSKENGVNWLIPTMTVNF